MKQILLIEDNQDHAELIQRSLSNGLGRVKVHLAERSSSALRLLSKQDFDLILSDYYLPDSKGEALIKKLSEKAPETPIIIITGQGDEKTAARSIKAGADDYIVKTRGALQALPKILNRAFTKHQANLNRKEKEIRKQLKAHEIAIKQVLEEVEAIEQKMTRLKKLSPSPADKGIGHLPIATLENLMDQVNGLKEFVQKMFSSGK